MCAFRTSKFPRNAWKSAVYLQENKNQRKSNLDVGYRREKTVKTWKKTKKLELHWHKKFEGETEKSTNRTIHT